MVFWIFLAVLTAAALLPLLRPLANPRRQAPAPAAHDAEVYRAQLAELEAQTGQGLIAPQEAEAARNEIARRLLAAGRRSDDAADTAFAAKPALMAAVAIFVPMAALGLYLVYGSPQIPDQPLAARLEDADSVEALVAKVEARLRENPEDGRGWDVLAPVYARLGRYDEAADAYRRAMQFLGETPERLTGFGEAATLANQGAVPDVARRAFEKALSEDASVLKAHFWLATADEQAGNYEAAAARWRDVLKLGGEGAPWRQVAEQRLAAAEARGRGEAPPGPPERDIAAAESMTAEQRDKMIAAMVEGLDKRLSANGDDLDGWMMLVRSYVTLGRRDEAADALARAQGEFEGNAEALRRLGALARSLGLAS